jgi:phosphate transport system substrate-binding protein
MNRATAWAALGLLLAGAAGCQRAERDAQHLVVTGSPEMAPLLKEIGKRFESSRPTVRVDVQATSTDRAVLEVRQGLADVGMVARGLRGDEVSLHAGALAYDGLVLVVHQTNPVPGLSEEQVAGLYLRSYTNWKQVGGPDRLVVLVDVAEGRAAREVFRGRFGIQASLVKPDHVVGGEGQATQAVAQLPGGVGYASLGPAQAAAAAGQAVRLVPLHGVAATPATLASGTYPLRRTLLLVTRQPGGLAGELVELARSTEIHDLVRQHGFVPAGP